MRRFTRLTNAFSKKLENHAHMVALYALWYNFVRIQKTLRTSPAMAAGMETRLWSMAGRASRGSSVGRASGRIGRTDHSVAKSGSISAGSRRSAAIASAGTNGCWVPGGPRQKKVT
jgi:hypothetical protein